MSKFISIARTRTTLKACALFVFTAVLAASFTGMLRGSMPDVQTGTWTVTGNLDGVRAGAAAALLPDGRVLVTGGSDGTATVDTVQAYGSDGGFSGAASMSSARADHTATVLVDGSMLIVGGRNTDGAVSSVEIFINGSWFAGGALTDARWGHTATLLADGRVLIAGGENGAGPLASFEIFAPAAGQVSPAGSLATARRGHAAARLADGRVIIAGGESLDGALDSTEFIDPATLSVSPGPALGSRRVGLSATTLLDGKVLFLGGNNGASNLASAELFNAATGAIAATASAAVARRDHQAFLLPNNNAVLIVGGIADIAENGIPVTAPTATAELFLPWLQQVWPTASMSSARVTATGSALSKESYGAAPAGDGLLMLAGGEGSNASEAYRFATIRTDKDDYVPGEQVFVSGSGWQPNELVTFTLKEFPGPCNLRTFEIAADEFGRISNAFLFDVEDHHLGVRFYLTARGAGSQAHVTFTDGNLGAISLSAPTSVSVAAGSTANYTVNVTMTGNNNICTVTLELSTALPAGATATFGSPNPTNATNVNFSRALTISTTLATPSGTYPFTVLATRGGNCNGSGNSTTNGTLVVTAATATATQPASASATFRTSAQTVALSATLTPAAINAGTVTFTVKDALNTVIGSPVTSATVSSSAASANFTLPANTGAGTYTITGEYSGGGGFAASSGTDTLTIAKAAQTITFGALGSKVYGDPPFTVAATGGASGQPVTFSLHPDSDGCSVTGDTVTILSATAVDESCIIVASQPGDSNYSAATDVARSFMIAKANPTVTAVGGTFVYNGNPQGGTGTATGVLSEPLTPVTLSYTGTGSTSYGPSATAPTNAGAYSVTATFAGDSNYNEATSTAAPLTIAKAPSTTTVSCTVGPFTYNGNPQTPCSVTVTGAGGLNETPAPTYTDNMNAGTATASYTYAESTNHLGSDDSETFVIAKAASTTTVSCTAGPFTYDGNPQTPCSVTVTGAGGLNQSPTPTYTDNVNAGTATASYMYAESANHLGSSDTETFVIAKRSATWTTQPNTKTYGNAEPSPVTTGSGTNFLAGDNVTATYARAAGETVTGSPYHITATLSAVSVGTLANYDITNPGADFTITKRAATVVVDDKSKLLNAPNPTLTGTLTNLVAADNITANYSTTATTGSPVGNYPISATLVDPNGKLANYTITNTPATLKILFSWDGFLQPINNTAHDGHQTLPYSKFKPGQTIPAKFQLKDANGVVVQQTGPAWFNYARIAGSCGGVEPDVDTDFAYEDTVPVYSFTGGHYQFNWSTKNLPMGLYRIFAILQNNQQVYTDICLTK